MTDSLIQITVWLSAISMGVMGGVYFAFSTFVMRSLNELPATTAIAAMNSINRVIIKSLFMPLFFGSSLLAMVLVVIGMLFPDSTPHHYCTAAGLIYLGGMLVCTIMRNVPLNNRLAQYDMHKSDAGVTWREYNLYWTRWNHVRTISSIVALAMLIG